MHNLYIFNPTGEMAIANGMASYMPPARLRKFEEDLSFLPSFFASKGDFIYTPVSPDDSFIKIWQELGIPTLNFISSFNSIKELNQIKPWSWNPAIHNKLKDIKQFCSSEFKKLPTFQWEENRKDFFSRNTTNIIQRFIHENNNQHSYINIPFPAINIHAISDLDEWMSKRTPIILKMPWSSSGRGIHVADFINKPLNKEWINGALKQQGYLTAEPLLNKVYDFSFQLEIKTEGSVEFKGISHFINDNKGHFIGGDINQPIKSTFAYLFREEQMNGIVKILIEAIQSVQPHLHHIGPIGVDAIIYMASDKQLKIHPCVDINWRYNMGNVNIILPKYLLDSSRGKWYVKNFKAGHWQEFVKTQSQTNPLCLNNQKIERGFIPLTPPHQSALFGAWMEIKNN